MGEVPGTRKIKSEEQIKSEKERFNGFSGYGGSHLRVGSGTTTN